MHIWKSSDSNEYTFPALSQHHGSISNTKGNDTISHQLLIERQQRYQVKDLEESSQYHDEYSQHYASERNQDLIKDKYSFERRSRRKRKISPSAAAAQNMDRKPFRKLHGMASGANNSDPFTWRSAVSRRRNSISNDSGSAAATRLSSTTATRMASHSADSRLKQSRDVIPHSVYRLIHAPTNFVLPSNRGDFIVMQDAVGSALSEQSSVFGDSLDGHDSMHRESIVIYNHGGNQPTHPRADNSQKKIQKQKHRRNYHHSRQLEQNGTEGSSPIPSFGYRPSEPTQVLGERIQTLTPTRDMGMGIPQIMSRSRYSMDKYRKKKKLDSLQPVKRKRKSRKSKSNPSDSSKDGRQSRIKIKLPNASDTSQKKKRSKTRRSKQPAADMDVTQQDSVPSSPKVAIQDDVLQKITIVKQDRSTSSKMISPRAAEHLLQNRSTSPLAQELIQKPSTHHNQRTTNRVEPLRYKPQSVQVRKRSSFMHQSPDRTKEPSLPDLHIHSVNPHVSSPPILTPIEQNTSYASENFKKRASNTKKSQGPLKSHQSTASYHPIPTTRKFQRDIVSKRRPSGNGAPTSDETFSAWRIAPSSPDVEKLLPKRPSGIEAELWRQH